MSRTHNYCFTHNNYPNTDLEDNIDCQYIIYGKEISSSGTPHLQGFIRFRTQQSLKAAIKALPGCHVEAANTLQAAMDYCKKEGEYVERGIRPLTPKDKGTKEKRKWADIRTAAEEGRLEDIPDDIRFNSLHLIKAHRFHALSKIHHNDTTERHEWYYGDSGTGKSRKARTDLENPYLKMCNKWWDRYDGEDNVLIEDFDKKHDVLAHHLKIWADRYPFLAEVKGDAIKIRPKKIIVTSNYHPKDIWTDPCDLEPILRRFKVTHFN